MTVFRRGLTSGICSPAALSASWRILSLEMRLVGIGDFLRFIFLGIVVANR
jgi:hypothetical protein